MTKTGNELNDLNLELTRYLQDLSFKWQAQ